MLRDDKPMIGVRRGARFLGVLTPAGVHRALRESLRLTADHRVPGGRSFRRCNGRNARGLSGDRHVPVPGLRDVLRAPAHRGVEPVGAGR